MHNVSHVPELRRVWLLSGTNKHDREIYYCEPSKVNKDFNLVAGRRECNSRRNETIAV